jgi:transcriptional regulator with XRE-family HTH domain
MTTPKTKGPNPIDVYVGSRVRMRRLMLNLSQEKLGTLGLTFQQVQKYEKGVNRMGSSRLQQAADILGVTVPFFFEGARGGTYQPDGSAPSPAYVNEFVSSEDGLRLIKAFARIPRPVVRQRIVALVREIAGDDGQ